MKNMKWLWILLAATVCGRAAETNRIATDVYVWKNAPVEKTETGSKRVLVDGVATDCFHENQHQWRGERLMAHLSFFYRWKRIGPQASTHKKGRSHGTVMIRKLREEYEAAIYRDCLVRVFLFLIWQECYKKIEKGGKWLELLGKQRKECAEGGGPLRAERAGASESMGRMKTEAKMVLVVGRRREQTIQLSKNPFILTDNPGKALITCHHVYPPICHRDSALEKHFKTPENLKWIKVIKTK
jgi:hypothetical protein